MCTVTFRPTPNGFVFTSSRDERYDRSTTIFPDHEIGKQGPILFPRDSEAKGTWFATNEHRLLCLLNGAFTKHARKESYVKSRGIMLLEAFEYSSITSFVEDYDLEGVEPFTLIWLEHAPNKISELRWTGTELVLTPKNELQDHIWSSSTLYDSQAIEKREQWFQTWIEKHPDPLQKPSLFHYQAGVDDQHDSVLLKRESKGTVSITSCIKEGNSCSITYDEFKNDVQTIDLRNELEKIQIS